MKINLSMLDGKILPVIRMIGCEADRLQLTAYLVGGVVRDALLGEKNFDFDIVIEGDAVALAKTVAAHHQAQLTVYHRFGTATVRFKNGIAVDFTTARSEHYSHPGALPAVKAGTIGEDLFRRDFTVNAMAAVINPGRYAELVDCYGGYDDLKRKKIRVLHDRSFIDDPTRILRAIRFEQRLRFAIEVRTLRLLKAALTNDAVVAVKPSRYFAEFRKFLTEPSLCRILKRLHAVGGWDFVFKGFRPDWRLLSRMQKNIAALGSDEFYRSQDWSVVYLIALFHGQDPAMIEALSTRFHLTRAEKAGILAGLQVRPILEKLRQNAGTPSLVYKILSRVDLETIYFIRAQTSVKIVARAIDVFLKKSRLTRLQINGHDLKNLGLEPGHAVGKILRAVLLKKIDGEVHGKSGELSAARSAAAGKTVARDGGGVVR